MKRKILITEDHAVFRFGLRMTLLQMYEDAEILEAEDFPSAKQTIENNPDISFILLDMRIPGTKGLEGLREIRETYPLLTIIMVSSLDFHETIEQILEAGANGFLAKSTPMEEMIEAITAILDGEVVVTSEHNYSEKVELSQRQREILRLLSQGLSNKKIAQELSISDTTVKEHVSNILTALKVDSRIGAALFAQNRGLIMDDDK